LALKLNRFRLHQDTGATGRLHQDFHFRLTSTRQVGATSAVHLIRLGLHAESARELEANAIQENQSRQATAQTAQAKSAAGEQQQKHSYEE
jgi:hypothetical protein